MRKLLTITLMLTLCAGIAAADTLKIHRMDIDTFHQRNSLNGPAVNTRSVFEGFESGAIPTGWAQGITNTDLTWDVSGSTSAGSVEGSYCAFVGYDSYNTQDETISFDQLVDVAGGEYNLSFYMAGAYGTSWDTNVAETVEVDGVTVFDFDSNVTDYFVYERFDVDLSAYDGQTVTITFRYAGIDGDLHVLDAVTVDDGTGYTPVVVPPPENNTCDGAIGIDHGDFTITGNTSTATNDYDPESGGCTGYYAQGNDVVYTIGLSAGQTFSVTMSTDGAFDDSIYLISDCGDPAGSCVAGADAYPDGSNFEYTATGTETLYLIVDAYSSGTGGVFTITGVNNGYAVANDDASWGDVKGMYR